MFGEVHLCDMALLVVGQQISRVRISTAVLHSTIAYSWPKLLHIECSVVTGFYPALSNGVATYVRLGTASPKSLGIQDKLGLGLCIRIL